MWTFPIAHSPSHSLPNTLFDGRRALLGLQAGWAFPPEAASLQGRTLS